MASVPNDTELRGLSTSPSGATSYAVLAAYSYLSILASRAFDNPGSAPLDFPSDRPLQLWLPRRQFAASCCLLLRVLLPPDLPRAVTPREQLSAASAARLSGPHRPRPCLQRHAALTDVCSFGCPDNTSDHRLPDLLGPLRPLTYEASMPHCLLQLHAA